MNKYFRYIAIFSLSLLFMQVSAMLYGQSEVKGSRLSKDSILIGDQVLWTTDIDIPAEGRFLFEPYSNILMADTTGAKVELLTDFVLDTLGERNGVRQVRAKLLMTSFDSGSYRLPQPLFIVESADLSDTLRFSTPVLSVNTIQVDTTGFVPMQIKGQMKYPLTFSEVAPWILGVILVALAIYLLIRYLKYRKENRDFFGRTIVKDPPHIVALRELDKLRVEKLCQNGKEKLFYTRLTDTLRAYIEGRFALSAMEKTTAEIMESLSAEKIEKRPYEELEELLKMADLVKFAKYVPDMNANEDAIPKAVRFVNSTFMQELEEEKEGK